MGKVGEKLEGLESYLWVVSVDAGVAGGGPATGAGGGERPRRGSGGRFGAGSGRGAPVGREEACGRVGSGRGRPEEGASRRARRRRRPWLGARARRRGRGVGGSGSMGRLRERSELACERDKDGMGRDSGAATRGSDVESGNGETTTFDGVSRGGAPGARVAGARCQGGAGWRKTGVWKAVLAEARHVAGQWPRRRRDGDERREQREEDGGDGIPVNNSKFQNAVCKFSFSPSSLSQIKNS